MSTFVTLGPEGTDHEHTLRAYLRRQGLADARVLLVDDMLEGLELVRSRPDHYLLQNSLHPDALEVTERHWDQVRVLDCFIAPTKPMAIIRRADAPAPRHLAVMPATVGYLRPGEWPNLITVSAKPHIGTGLLSGMYEAGLTHLSWAVEHPDELVLIEQIGPVDTVWIVYGTSEVRRGLLTGMLRPDLYCGAAVRA
ncbi:hypothetical protein AB0M28_13025 [Streptomyces sp. NPDC051940]|uniref:hypothetical protein n=1 Tax=Streptomyces sp. NPDC051940 TaxID=3155675 RepID=UPI003429DF47